MTAIRCRFCDAELHHVFADLGVSPLSNAFLRAQQLEHRETFYPLTVYVCAQCLLVQLPASETPENIFGDYAYFSSYSDSWLAHARDYCRSMIARLGLDAATQVVEIASNDGYLLQYFLEAGVPVLGVEPAANVAAVAQEKGIETVVRFFGVETARALAADGRKAKLLLGNNVLAHVPDLNDFVAGVKILLDAGGVITMEFPHLMRLIDGNQFDTIYHEHFSYFSLLAVQKIFAAHGLTIVDVDELPTHGGSLRIHARHTEEHGGTTDNRVAALLAAEREFGLDRIETYARFAEQVRKTKRDLLSFLIRAREEGKQVVGYGAPAKGNTLLNYCGIRADFIDYTVDRSPHKQGLFLPGTRIPIHAPDRIRETKPDFILILPWNLKDEVIGQMADVRAWGGVSSCRSRAWRSWSDPGVIFTETLIVGAFLIDLERREDERGFFARTFCENEFRANGLEPRIAQCNISWNRAAGTLRGLHYQAAPHEETKIVRCTSGGIWDVVVDLRPDSSTYGQWTGVELTSENRRALYIPRGLAHGFITRTDDAEVLYMMGETYVEGAARGIAWDDPAFAIQWPIAPAVISGRDRSYPPWPVS